MLQTQNIEFALNLISRNIQEACRAWNAFYGYVEHWRTLGQLLYQGSFELLPCVASSSMIRGTIATKAFAINACPVVIEEKSFIEVLISAEFPQLGVRVESLRFLISPTGDFHRADGTKLIGAFDEKSSHSILASILENVLKTPMPRLADGTIGTADIGAKA